jgi:hypothetical protein
MSMRKRDPEPRFEVDQLRRQLASAAVDARSYAWRQAAVPATGGNAEDLPATGGDAEDLPLPSGSQTRVHESNGGPVTHDSYGELIEQWDNFPNTAVTVTQAFFERPDFDVNATFTNPTFVGARRTTLLLSAVCRKRMDLVNALIDAGANVNQLGSDHVSPLYEANELGLDEVVPLLLRNGADVFEAGAGRTPTVRAVQLNRLTIMPALVQAATSRSPGVLDTPDTVWPHRKPLAIAAVLGLTAMVRLLLGLGADPTARDDDGETSLTLAIELGWTEIEELLRGKLAHMPQQVPPADLSVYLPDLPERRAVRGRRNHTRGMAVFAWTHRWDRFLVEFRGGFAAVVQLLLQGADDGGRWELRREHAPLFAFFCPMIHLQRHLRAAGIPNPEHIEDESISVVRVLSEPPRAQLDQQCPLELQLDEDATNGDRIVDALVTAFGALNTDPVNVAQSNERKEMLNDLMHTLSRMEAALVATCKPLPAMTTYRMINTEKSTIEIMEDARNAWAASSRDEIISFRFCRENYDEPCVMIEVNVTAGTMGIEVGCVLPRSWKCYNEREVLIAYGCSWTWTADTPEVLDEANVITQWRRITATVRHGMRPVWRITQADPREWHFWGL